MLATNNLEPFINKFLNFSAEKWNEYKDISKRLNSKHSRMELHIC